MISIFVFPLCLGRSVVLDIDFDGQGLSISGSSIRTAKASQVFRVLTSTTTLSYSLKW